MNRIGHALLWIGGFVLAGLMAYTVAFDFGHGGARRPVKAGRGEVTVAVFYPDRTLWQEFRHGVRACIKKGLATPVEESEGAVVIVTPTSKRLIRFELHGVRGLRETKDEVRRLLERSPPPLAFVGSSNTVLTEAIAEALRAAAGPEGGKGPVLLVPWASAVLADRPEPGEGPVALLDVNPGRTFRFCPNNQLQADLLIRCLANHDAGRPPGRAMLVVDRHDPYSEDLAASFQRAVKHVARDTEIVEKSASPSLPVLNDSSALPGPAEEALAESIWRDAEGQPGGRTTWVLLPLQDEPTRRMIAALRRHAHRGSRPGDGLLRVVCGDGIGFSNLSQLAGRCPFTIWSSSSASAPAAAQALGQGLSPDTQIPAEIVSALVCCLDPADARPESPTALRDALAALHLNPNDRAAMGRSLAFSRNGERVGDDVGHVLMIRPDRRAVFAVTRRPHGGWNDPEPLVTLPVVSQP